MPLLIDGYNLLSVAGIVGAGRGAGSLARARLAMLNFLAESLDPEDVGRTTIVFDAVHAPPGLPRIVSHRGLTVRFAAGYPDADSLLEELIDEDSSPRRLTVVSSDHRVQRAARRRRAKPIDADVWYASTIRQRQRRLQREQIVPARPPVPLLAEDVAYWVRQFGGPSVFEELIRQEDAEGSSVRRVNDTTASPGESSSREAKDDPDPEKPRSGLDGDLLNPFPPGYGEDLGPL